MDSSVEKLHRALVSAITQARDGDFNKPVTVSEIYQQLLPYRAARTAVGFDMNADYEYALLRLLAGEGNLARLEPGEVRETLRSELESPNPNVSIFREYANCDVWITAPPKWVFEMVDEPDVVIPPVDTLAEEEAELLLEDAVDEEEHIEEQPFTPETQRPKLATPEPASPTVPTPASVPTPSPAAVTCAFCDNELPAGRLANFCPHCGSDLTQRPCPACGEILEPMWRFCANCGTQVTGYDSAAN